MEVRNLEKSFCGEASFFLKKPIFFSLEDRVCLSSPPSSYATKLKKAILSIVVGNLHAYILYIKGRHDSIGSS